MLIAQITDLHVGSEAELRTGRVVAAERLARAVVHLTRFDPPPDVVLATGDLTKDGAPEEYEAVQAALEPLPASLFLIPGNHDRREPLRAAFPDHSYLSQDPVFLHHVVEEYPLRLVGLDTLVPGESGGILCGERLAWLESRLAEGGGRPTLLYMHHPPFATGIPAFDRMGCENAPALGEIVARHPEIQAIVCGHVHRAISLRWRGTVVHVTPSTFVQYPLQLHDTAIAPVDEPPAYALHRWTPGAGLVSHLVYVT